LAFLGKKTLNWKSFTFLLHPLQNDFFHVTALPYPVLPLLPWRSESIPGSATLFVSKERERER
jgi:hypothetical protein